MRDTSTGYLSHTPNWEPGPQVRNVPWPGIELVTLWFTGWSSIHPTTPARARKLCNILNLSFHICNMGLMWLIVTSKWIISWKPTSRYATDPLKNGGCYLSNVTNLESIQQLHNSSSKRLAWLTFWYIVFWSFSMHMYIIFS